MSRSLTAAYAVAGLAAVAGSVAIGPTPLVLWNATASAPVGLYRVQHGGALHVGDWVAALPPAGLDRTFATRGYLPMGVPLVKRVVAMAPSRVCRHARLISIDGRAVAAARGRDRLGRDLPTWRGCLRLPLDQVFLLNAASDSLDSRYFGPLFITNVVGRLTPIWMRGVR